MGIKESTLDLAQDPFNAEINFALAEEYMYQLQYASAAGFYLRAAEYGYATDPIMAYTSLLKMVFCWETQGDREATVYNNLLQAVALLPTRPEAYFLLARLHERKGEWQKCFTFAEMGLLFASNAYHRPLPSHVDYFGSFCLLFEKAVACWWLGRRDECKATFHYLLDEYKMPPEYVSASLKNLELFNVS